jgi:aspartate/methionine/tyrosine aminotransferase
VFSARTNWNLSKNRYTESLESARESGAPLLDLTASNPTTIGLTYPEKDILATLAQPQALVYDPASRGMASAREAVACYYAEQGVLISEDDVVMTVSTSEAYSYCFRLLCDPGDEVLVPAPSYPLFEFLADLQDVKLVPYELVYDHGWQIEIESLRRRITPRSRAIMVVHPNNPTGHYTKAWELEVLNRLCEYHNLAIIADEVFMDYSLTLDKPLSFASNRGALTFTLSGLSKISGLPQMKAAWIVVSGPEAIAREADARLEVIADTYLSPNAPIQQALPVLLEVRRTIQYQLLKRVQQNLNELDRLLKAQVACSRLDVEGGWYAVLRVPVVQSDEDLAIKLMQRERILVHPGHFFNFPSDGYIVVSLIAPPLEFADGIGRMLKMFMADAIAR